MTAEISAAAKGAARDGTAGFTQARRSGRGPGGRTGTGFHAGRCATTRPVRASATDDRKHHHDRAMLRHLRGSPPTGVCPGPRF